jgi:hypothetical protein
MRASLRRFVGLWSLLIAAPQAASGQPLPDAPSDLHAVDFRNYVYSRLDGVRVRVRDGEWRLPIAEDALSAEALGVDDVAFGDLTGDGRDEAVVSLSESSGGTGRFTFANVYTPGTPSPRRVGRIPSGDRADGGLAGVRIVSGRIEVDRIGHDRGGAMDPEWVETEVWSLRGEGIRLDRTERRRAYLNAFWGPGHARRFVASRRFSSALIQDLIADPAREERWTLRAPGRRAVDVDLTRERLDGLRVDVRTREGASLGSVAGGQRATIVLASGSEYLLVATARAAGGFAIELRLDAPTPRAPHAAHGPQS